jgi:serine/threonine-protein phosphatase 2B catalytic subunit
MASRNQDYFQLPLYQIPERELAIPGGALQWSNEPGVSYKERAVPSVSILVKTRTGCRKFDPIVLQQVPQHVADLPIDEELFLPDAYGELLLNADFLKQHFLP